MDIFLNVSSDDGISPERIAQVMGQPDRCQHAVHLINELVHTAQVLFFFSSCFGVKRSTAGLHCYTLMKCQIVNQHSNHTLVKHPKTGLNSSTYMPNEMLFES